MGATSTSASRPGICSARPPTLPPPIAPSTRSTASCGSRTTGWSRRRMRCGRRTSFSTPRSTTCRRAFACSTTSCGRSSSTRSSRGCFLGRVSGKARSRWRHVACAARSDAGPRREIGGKHPPRSGGVLRDANAPTGASLRSPSSRCRTAEWVATFEDVTEQRPGAGAHRPHGAPRRPHQPARTATPSASASRRR